MTIIQSGTMKMNFKETQEFKRDFKKLFKKFRSLKDDLNEFKKVLRASPLGIGKHFNVITKSESVYIVKARFFCRSLKKKSLRIIYAYAEDHETIDVIGIEFIEVYFKGKKQNENRDRIRSYLKQYRKNE